MDGIVSLIILIVVTRRKRIFSSLLLMILTREEINAKREKTMTKLLRVENKTWDIFAFKNVRYISPYLRLICLWNFQGGSNNNRISNRGTEKGAGLSTKSFCYIYGRPLNFLLPSVFGGYKFPPSNWDHQWQSFPFIQWISKKFYIIIFVFFKRKKNRIGWMINFPDMNVA